MVMSESKNNSANNHKINYIEFVSTDIARTKKFYSTVFGWGFEDWGPEYVSFSGAGVDGGFRAGEGHAEGPLVILYATDLAATERAVIAAGGRITVPTFEFPGGRRFHFADGAGNVLAVWSE
jgi:predicted enzyme related to lactoylglutathione lyase